MRGSTETAKDDANIVDLLAGGSFRDHVLTERRPWVWKCAAPDSWSYGFYLLIAPGAVLIYGDVGEATFRMSGTGGPTAEDGVLDWLKRCSKDSGYMLSKLSNRDAYRSFFPGDALAYARSTGDADFIDEVEERASDGLTADAFYRMAQEHGDYQPPSCIDWNASVYWMAKVVETFVRLV